MILWSYRLILILMGSALTTNPRLYFSKYSDLVSSHQFVNHSCSCLFHRYMVTTGIIKRRPHTGRCFQVSHGPTFIISLYDALSRRSSYHHCRNGPPQLKYSGNPSERFCSIILTSSRLNDHNADPSIHLRYHATAPRVVMNDPSSPTSFTREFCHIHTALRSPVHYMMNYLQNIIN